MDKQDQDPEDYGYDLAHEAKGVSEVPHHRPGHEHGSPPRVGGKADLDEDFGYDEAHDI